MFPTFLTCFIWACSLYVAFQDDTILHVPYHDSTFYGGSMRYDLEEVNGTLFVSYFRDIEIFFLLKHLRCIFHEGNAHVLLLFKITAWAAPKTLKCHGVYEC